MQSSVPVDSFRYKQFCPLARATEILGHRWVLLILRELFIGPQRFSDLRRRLPGLSSSVLADRLTGLEEQGVVGRRDLAPPAAATVYELTQDGQALRPVLLALARWGARFLGASEPGDHVEPDWLGLAIDAFARTDPTPARRFELRPCCDDRMAVLRVAGGPTGTRSIRDDLPVDASIQAPMAVMLGLMSGEITLATLRAAEDVEIEGNVDALSDLPKLFEMN